MNITTKLEYLRKEVREERISYDELAELERLAHYIPDDDVELLEAAGVPEGQRETSLRRAEMRIKAEGWLLTDGSDNTLQYGRKVPYARTLWEYRQWLDELDPFTGRYITIPGNTKKRMWEDERWVSAKIDLRSYSLEEIRDAISTFGYSIHRWILDGDVWIDFQLKQGGDVYNTEDSIQLACESVFELM